MGLFRALIVILVGLFTISIIENNTYLSKIPFIGDKITDRVKSNKHYIVVYVIAFIMLIL